MTTVSADPGAVESPADDEGWLRATERQEAVRALTIEQLRAHLALQGWFPVETKNAALQQGSTRVLIFATSRGLSTRITYQYTAEESIEVPWHSVNKEHLRMLAHRIAGMP